MQKQIISSMNREIILLIDYRDQFYFSTRYRGACADVDKLIRYFHAAGYNLIIKHFHEINIREKNYKDKWILYQSSEDPKLLYKDYLEDVLLVLELQGAKLIPRFQYFRAHHNKVFMELLRDLLPITEVKNIISRGFGTYEEYQRSDFINSKDSIVLKPGSGTRSYKVSLLDTSIKRKRYPYKISRIFTIDNLKLLISKIKTGKTFIPISNNRSKFIVQNFVPNLDGDYRILAYGEKYYAVFRGTRDNDFRASGSGKLDFETKLPDGLLNYAKCVYSQFDTPFMSLDIGHDNGTFYLFEFQCLCLGQYTLEKSKFYYRQNINNQWEQISEIPDLERELSSAVIGKYPVY